MRLDDLYWAATYPNALEQLISIAVKRTRAYHTRFDRDLKRKEQELNAAFFQPLFDRQQQVLDDFHDSMKSKALHVLDERLAQQKQQAQADQQEIE